MRRLARRLFTLCSALSLLLCVAVCVLWVRSYWVADKLDVYWGGRPDTPHPSHPYAASYLEVEHWRGSLMLVRDYRRATTPRGWNHTSRPARVIRILRNMRGVGQVTLDDPFRGLSTGALGVRWYAGPRQPWWDWFL